MNSYLKDSYIWSVDGMAFRDSYMSWVDKSQSESKKMMESFADKCRDQKVSVVTFLLLMIVGVWCNRQKAIPFFNG